jgi:hypothetical protein
MRADFYSLRTRQIRCAVWAGCFWYCAHDTYQVVGRRILNAFRRIPWEATCGRFGVPDIDQLAQLLDFKAWLSTAHADALLELIEKHPDLPQNVEVIETHVLHMLCELYNNKQPIPTWLSDLAVDALRDEKVLITILSVMDGRHFAGLVVDLPARTLWFGDSLDGPRPEDMRTSLQRLFNDAHPGQPAVTFAWAKLPTGVQADMYHCLIFSTNMLAAHLDLEPMLHTADAERKRALAFCELVEFHVSLGLSALTSS